MNDQKWGAAVVKPVHYPVTSSRPSVYVAALTHMQLIRPQQVSSVPVPSRSPPPHHSCPSQQGAAAHTQHGCSITKHTGAKGSKALRQHGADMPTWLYDRLDGCWCQATTWRQVTQAPTVAACHFLSTRYTTQRDSKLPMQPALTSASCTASSSMRSV